MMLFVLKHIKGKELPQEWVEKFKLSTERSFTIKIEPDTPGGLPPAPTFEERQKYLVLLEALRDEGEEDSEAWIHAIKTKRSASKQRVDLP